MFLILLFGSIGGLVFILMRRRRTTEQTAGEMSSPAAVQPGSGAPSEVALPGTTAPADEEAPFLDPTTTLFLLMLIVSLAALIYIYPDRSSKPRHHAEDDPPEA